MNYSLFKRPGSSFYSVKFRVGDPDRPGQLKQVLKSTKATTKGEAHERAKLIIEAAQQAAGGDDDRNRRIHDLVKEAADLATRGQLNEHSGRDIVSRMMEISAGRKLREKTVRQYFDDWVDEVSKTRAHGTYLRYKGTGDTFVKSLGDRADLSLMVLDFDDVRSYRDAERAAGKTAKSVNTDLKTLRTALNKAKRQGLLLHNPADGVEVLEEEDTIRQPFPAADVARVIAVAEDEWKGAIIAGYYTGARLSDIVNFTWSNLDLKDEVLTFTPKKTRRKKPRPIILPIHPELLDWLLTQDPGDDPVAPVFPSLYGKATGGKSGLSMKFSRLMEKAGVKGETIEAEGEKGRARNTIGFHSLRHACNSALANRGVVAEIRNKLTGHGSAEMNAKYTHAEVESLRKAITTVPRISE